MEFEKILADEEVNGMSLQEYEIHKEKRQDNARYIEKVIKGRIHDAPVLNECITSIVSDKPDDLFFFNQKLLHDYSKKNVSRLKKAYLAQFFF